MDETTSTTLQAAQQVDLTGLQTSLDGLAELLQAWQESINTLLVNTLVVNVFSVLVSLVSLGVCLVLVFVVAARRQ